MTELTVPLAERVQYASPGWITEATRYLGSRPLPSPPFSLSVELTDPPPSLVDGNDGPFGYTVRVAEGTATVLSLIHI